MSWSFDFIYYFSKKLIASIQQFSQWIKRTVHVSISRNTVDFTYIQTVYLATDMMMQKITLLYILHLWGPIIVNVDHVIASAHPIKLLAILNFIRKLGLCWCHSTATIIIVFFMLISCGCIASHSPVGFLMWHFHLLHNHWNDLQKANVQVWNALLFLLVFNGTPVTC